MKKFLALVLALVMTMSLVTISAGAEDFTDDSKITYEEAVDVMTAVGVVGGYADGSFNPTAGLTRGAAAKIICNMILGPTTAEALAADTAPYSDVAVDNVFAGYIAYCAKEGIISGYADGTFRPAAPLTGYAFMKMLLGALGYDAAIEGYTGSNWSINVAKQALNIDLDAGLKGDFVGTKALTREEACLYAFNTMKATMVEYKNASSIVVGDITVTTTSEKSNVANGNADYTANSTTGNTTMQFCEKFFSNLKVWTTSDVNGRPANQWKVKNDKVGTYAKTPVLTYTAEVKGTVLADDLDAAGLEVVARYDANDNEVAPFEVYINGADCTAWGTYFGETLSSKAAVAAELTQKSDLGFTGKGIVIEIYADSDDYVSRVVALTPYVAQVTAIAQDKASTKSVDERALTVSFTAVGPQNVTSMIIDADTVGFDAVYAEVEEEDYVVVTPYGGDVTLFAANGAKTVSVALPETVTGVVSASGTYSATIDGTAYDFAAFIQNAPAVNANDPEVTLYLDDNGYVLGSSTKAVTDKTLVVLDTYQSLDSDGALVDMAKVVFSDGTTDSIVLKAANEVAASTYAYTYTVDKGVYDLTAIDGWQADADTEYLVALATEIKTSTKKLSVAQGKTRYFDDDVNFVFVAWGDDFNANTSSTWNGKATVKTGVQKLVGTAQNNINLVVVENDDDEIATVYVFAKAANTVTDSNSILFVAKQTGDKRVADGEGDYDTYKTYDAYIGAEAVVDCFSADDYASPNFYYVEQDADTKAYVLDAYNDTNEDIQVTGLEQLGTAAVSHEYLITVDSNVEVDLRNATFVDYSENGIDNLSALKYFLEVELTANTYVNTYVMYDAETNVAEYVYITAVNQALVQPQ